MKKITALIVMCLMLNVVVISAFLAAPASAIEIPPNLKLLTPDKEFTEKKVRYNVTADAYIDKSNPNSNYGSTHYLWVGDQPYETRSYLKFNITKPTFSYAYIKKIDLYMYYTGQDFLSYNGVSKIGFTQTPWSESTITWNTAPTDYEIIPNTLYHSGLARDIYVHFIENYCKNFTIYMTSKIMNDWNKYPFSTFTLVLMKDHAIGGSYMGEKTYTSDERENKAYIVITYGIYPKVYYYQYEIVATADAYADQRYPTWKFGHNTSLLVGYEGGMWQIAYIFFENDYFLGHIAEMFPDFKFTDYALELYAKNNVPPTYVVEINRTSFARIDEDLLCWDNRPGMGTTQAIADIFVQDSHWHYVLSDVFSNAMKYQMETWGAVLISLYSTEAMNDVEYASREYNNPIKTTPRLDIIFTSSVQIFYPPEPTPVYPDISEMVSTGCWLFGLIGMFASIPLVVYRIKNGDDEIQAITLGLAVFAISVGLFFAGGAPL